MRAVLKIILILILLISCSKADKSNKIEFSFEGKIVFVEDIDGKDGLLSGSFGDLILLDGTNNFKERLTNDSFYDSNPTWSTNGEKIYFESKRDPQKLGHGLSKGSDLYIYDLETSNISNFGNTLRKKYPEKIGLRISEPAVSQKGNKFVFISNPDNESKLLLLDLEKDSVQILNIPYELFGIENFRWSLDGKHFSFRFYPDNAVVKAIAIYSVKTQEIKVGSKQVLEGPLSGEEATTCSGGSWANTTKVIFSCRKLGNIGSTVYEYDLQENISTKLFSVDSLNVISPQINSKQRKIIFIGYNDDSEYDIWSYDIDKKKYTQLTNDLNTKRWLSWYN